MTDGLTERPGTGSRTGARPASGWARGATRYGMGSRSDPVPDPVPVTLRLAERPGAELGQYRLLRVDMNTDTGCERIKGRCPAAGFQLSRVPHHRLVRCR